MMGAQFRGMKKTVAWLFPIICSLIFSSLVCAATDEDCMQCHSDEKLTTKRKGQTVSLYVDLKKFSRSAHKQAGCAGCHSDADVKEFPHPEKLGSVKCGNCHGDPDKEFNTGIHGKALAKRTLRPHLFRVSREPLHSAPEESQLPHLQNEYPLSLREMSPGRRSRRPNLRYSGKKYPRQLFPEHSRGGFVQAGGSSSPPHATIAMGTTSFFPILMPGRPRLPITSRRLARFAIPRSNRSI